MIDHPRPVSPRGTLISRLGALLLLAATLALLAPPPVAAASIVWDRYDVTLTLRPDGSYHVVEEQRVDFGGGSFSVGYAELPTARTEGIVNLAVGERTAAGLLAYTPIQPDDYVRAPSTYTARPIGDIIRVDFAFAPTDAADPIRTFILEYDVLGALRVYPGDPTPRQQIWWTALDQEALDIAPAHVATLTIRLPRPVDPVAVVQTGDQVVDAAAHTTDGGQTWVWERRNLTEDEPFEIRFEFPAIVAVGPPSWQTDDDARREREEKADDRQALVIALALGAGLLTVVGGAIGLAGLWYTRGRDPRVGLVADFLTAPPEGLPPALVGSLVDEVVHPRDVLATLLDLARRGVLTIEELPAAMIGGVRLPDFRFTIQEAEEVTAPFERRLLDGLFASSPGLGHGVAISIAGVRLTLPASPTPAAASGAVSAGLQADGRSITLSAARTKFTRAVQTISPEIETELVARGYFDQPPSKIRNKWSAPAFIVGFAGIVLSIILARTLGGGAPLFSIGGVVLAVAFGLFGRVMPRKTPTGAEVAARCRAFRRYLADIKRYENVAEATTAFDAHLPYAVALGLGEEWVKTFATTSVAMPTWYIRDHSRASSSGGAGGELQGASDAVGGSLQSMSDGLLGLFNSAGRAVSGGSSGSSGGFSGGGSRGGSSGGGGRGFG